MEKYRDGGNEAMIVLIRYYLTFEKIHYDNWYEIKGQEWSNVNMRSNLDYNVPYHIRNET